MKVLGINSGTSVDGVDLALVEWDSCDNLKDYAILATESYEFPSKLKFKIESLITSQQSFLGVVAETEYQYSCYIAELVNDFKEKYPEFTIDLIGCHGQTIYHTTKFTWQIGDGSIIANLTGINCIHGFRNADMALGGCGAPLTSFIDDRLVRDDGIAAATLNIGGIANISVLEPGKPTLAYDTGPGNTLVDALTQRLFHKPFDVGGEIAFKGKIDHLFIRKLIECTPYFSQSLPKATGRELFDVKYAEKFLDLGNTLNIIATVTAFTAKTVSIELQKYSLAKVYMSGGGANNKFLIQELQSLNSSLEFVSHDETGILAKYKEAILFSLLAYTSYNKTPNNVPSATGAQKQTILGKISYV